MIATKRSNKSQFVKSCKISWQEVTSGGKVQDKFFMCESADAMWHVTEMKKSPSVIINIKVGK